MTRTAVSKLAGAKWFCRCERPRNGAHEGVSPDGYEELIWLVTRRF